MNLVLNPNVGDIGDSIEAWVGYDGGIGQQYWVGVSWGDGTPRQETVNTGWTSVTFTHQYQAEGTFTVTAQVQDLVTGEPGTDSEQATIQAGAEPPPVRIGFIGTPSAGQIPFTTTFTVAMIDGIAPYVVSVDYGDGNGDSWTYPIPTTFTITHTYYAGGRFTATATVTDSLGASASAQVIITASIGPVIPAQDWTMYALAAAGAVAIIGAAYLMRGR